MTSFDFSFDRLAETNLGDSMIPMRPAFTGVQAAQAPVLVSITPVGAPTQDNELTFLTGVDSTGHIAATSFGTWNGNNPATYSSNAWVSKWGGDTAGSAGGTVDYYFDVNSNWTATEKTWLAAGLALWSAEANINFVQTTTPGLAQLKFFRGAANTGAYESTNQTPGVVGGVTIPHPLGMGSGKATGAYISIDTTEAGFGPIDGSFDSYGGYVMQTLVHEEGHAIGLGHGGPYNGNVNQTTQQFSPYDMRLWTLMSYIDNEAVYTEIGDAQAKYTAQYPVQGSNWGYNTDGYFYEPTTPMTLDIAAAQRLYGAPTSGPLVSGGQIFGFNTNLTGAIAPFFDFTQNAHPVITIWDGGTGNTLDLSGYTLASTVNLHAGTFSSVNGMIDDIGIAFGTKIDTAVGGAGADTLIANDDGDTLTGNAGNDTLVGGAGVDTMTGGAGDDTYHVVNSGAVLVELAGGGHDLVYSSVTFTLPSFVEDITLTGTANINATGNNQSNIMNGNDGDNVISGGDGNDTIFGHGGNDTLYGGAGADKLDGGTGADHMYGGAANTTFWVDNIGDVVIADAGAGIDTVNSTISYTLADNVEILNLLDAGGAIDGTGNGLNNTITGNASANHITGGLGQDTLTGGGGADTFVFTGLPDSATAKPDTITDFVSGQDLIDLSAIDANSKLAGDQAFHLGATAGHTGDIVVTYDAAHSRTVLDLYVDANGSIDGRIWLTGDHSGMTAADFVL